MIDKKSMASTPPKSKQLQHSTNLTLDRLPTAIVAYSLTPKKKLVSSKNPEFSTL